VTLFNGLAIKDYLWINGYPTFSVIDDPDAVFPPLKMVPTSYFSGNFMVYRHPGGSTFRPTNAIIRIKFIEADNAYMAVGTNNPISPVEQWALPVNEYVIIQWYNDHFYLNGVLYNVEDSTSTILYFIGTRVDVTAVTVLIDYISIDSTIAPVITDSVYIPPRLNLKWCDVNHGTHIGLYEVLRQVSNVLYDAISAVMIFEDWVGTKLSLIFPSGLAWLIIDAGTLQDFRLPEKTYWGVNIYLSDIPIAIIPLPYVDASDNFLANLLAPLNQPIAGSEHRYYQDIDGVVKLGTDIVPMRQYHLLSDGIRDVTMITLIVAIIGIVIYVLPKVGAKIVTWLIQRNGRRKVLTKEDQIYDAISSQLSEFYDIQSLTVLNSNKLDRLISQVGLRMKLH
jgi:hypothetical protein